ncbi:class I SAM-dependent methyltransferase [Chloroflexi bacterium CFX5]|nr:class I SAM-dependent methyltransferase [Chloroflexi bacterium CFX5]NUQ58436.1 class I SAM-dependent methyltransferase [Anaerolineales bacterium]
MDPREYEIMYRAETRHWWYLGMAVITKTLLERRARLPRRLNILDAGCGTGAAMTSYLADYGDVTGVDLSPQALNFSRERHASRLARASALNLPLASASFDLVASFDVLCSCPPPGELQALREFHRALKPGGWLILRLPAYNWLRGRHDERVHIRQRFTSGQIKSLLRQCGFIAEHLSYANMLLFPLAAVKRTGERLLKIRSEASELSIHWTNEWFRRILTWEAPLVAGVGLPCGLSVFALARKPGAE